MALTIKDIKVAEDTDNIPKEVVNTPKDSVVNILKAEASILKEVVSILKEVDNIPKEMDNIHTMEIAINKEVEDMDMTETGSKEDVLVDIPVDTLEETDFTLEDRINSHLITLHSGEIIILIKSL